MIYGLYLSASGVLASSHRQDVIANNLANAETVGFKRDLATLTERRVETSGGMSDPRWRNLTGGLWAAATATDHSQGELETTGNPTDVAIEGRGYFMVQANAKSQPKLTRDGRFLLDRSGNLIVASGDGEKVLDIKGKPITLDGRLTTEIDKDGTVTQNGAPVAQIGVFDVPDTKQLKKEGAGQFSYPKMADAKPTADARLRSGFVERANVDPAAELVQLMDAQRQLEANANMIRFQDQTMSRLVNDVAKIS